MAEGARLESVFTRKGNVGSNPTLSAIQSELQRNSAALPPELREIGAILQILIRNRTGESVPRNPRWPGFDASLWSAYTRSGFSHSFTRTQCDHKTDHEAKVP